MITLILVIYLKDMTRGGNFELCEAVWNVKWPVVEARTAAQDVLTYTVCNRDGYVDGHVKCCDVKQK